MKVLAIGAHPDDIEIFMFGLLLSYKARNDNIYVAIATDGGAGNILDYSDIVEVRKKETQNALKVLGDPYFFNFPDGKLSSCAKAPKKIKEYIDSISPHIIVTHAPEDYHPDHQALSLMVKYAAGFSCPVLYADTLMGVNFKPDYYVDITPFFVKKENAILKHKSQNPERFFKATKLLNRFRAAQCNIPENNYAEAYRTENKFPFGDIRNLIPNAPDIKPFYKNFSDSMI